MRKPLKVKLEVFHNHLVGTIIEQDSDDTSMEGYKYYRFVASNGVSIRSTAVPAISVSPEVLPETATLFIRGAYIDGNHKLMVIELKSEEAAQHVKGLILTAIAEFNSVGGFVGYLDMPELSMRVNTRWKFIAHAPNSGNIVLYEERPKLIDSVGPTMAGSRVISAGATLDVTTLLDEGTIRMLSTGPWNKSLHRVKHIT